MVGVFFLTYSSILDLGHFSQVILPIVLLIMPQLSGAVHSIWWLGFFLTCSQILDLGHFSQIILPIVLQTICPTIRCCSQHLMVGVNFFFDLFSHSGLRAFFTSDFANCTTDYMLNHQLLFTASDGWVFFTCSQILDLGHFSQIILPIVLQTLCLTIRCCSQHLMVGVNFFLTSSPILDLGHFSQVILPIVLQIMPQPKNNPNDQVLWTASDGWGYFFFDLFSHSGLRAFFTSDFANCTTDYAPTIRCCSQHLMVGFFFDMFSDSGLRAFFTNNFANCTTDYMPNHQVLWTASDGWG